MYRPKHDNSPKRKVTPSLLTGMICLTLAACSSPPQKINTAPGTAFRASHVKQFAQSDEQNFVQIRTELKAIDRELGVMWHFAPSKLGLQTGGGVVRVDPDFFAGLAYEAQFFAMAHEWAHIKLHSGSHVPGQGTEIEADDLASQIMQAKGLNACLGIIALNQRARNGIGQDRVDRQCQLKVAVTH